MRLACAITYSTFQELLSNLGSQQSRELSKAEKRTIALASDGCESLNSQWTKLGAALSPAVAHCHEHSKGAEKSEDCRKLWARVLLSRSRGEMQIGAGASLGSTQPACAAIQTVMYALQQGAK